MLKQKAISVFGFLGMVAAILGLITTKSILARFPAFAVVQAIAVLLMLWARLTFGLRSFHLSADATPGNLVTSGPYRVIRHPIYASVVFFVFAAALSRFSLLNAVFAVFCLAGALTRIFIEEQLLRKQFPGQYESYARKTWRIIPFIF
ncbi:MAG: isoprenylcysteine carboxylmethyltransferase family protein [Acidobacteria bacterium]|nr:isoprenylcysteine carboxylmethyltransferase family protein [Acidobacteriota bacterium]